MGWLYISSLDGFKTPTEYLDHQFTFDREERSYLSATRDVVRLQHSPSGIADTAEFGTCYSAIVWPKSIDVVA
jgi:hypothetical protein